MTNNIKEKLELAPASTLLEKVMFCLILPFFVFYAFGVFSWCLVIHFWETIESLVNKKNIYKK